jgi:hypothetical protein
MRSCFLVFAIVAIVSLASICAQAQQENASLYATSYIEVVPASEAAAGNALKTTTSMQRLSNILRQPGRPREISATIQSGMLGGLIISP